MSTIEIHEFSTGIDVQGTPDNWCSVGFSGGYMNSTLSYIPRSVQQEIAADLFYLSEFAVQEKPAIIGREVKLGQEEWSVLAVINHAKDECGRGISVSRYFLTEGLGKLNDLLTYQQSNNLTFNPFDKKKYGDRFSYDTNKTKNNDLLHLLDNHEELIKNILVLSTTTTKTGTRIPLKAIHQLAEKKAKELKQLVSWAYDVEGLKKPHDFLIIYPCNALNVDQYVQKQLENHPISQYQLRKNQQTLTIDNHLKQGVNYLIFHLIQHPELLESVVWLVTDKEGLWGGAYQEFINDLWADIKQIVRNYKTAKAKLDEDIKQRTGSRHSMTSQADIEKALKEKGYELTYASENLMVLNQKDWQEIKDYFIDLIWYKDGKSIKNERFLPLADLIYTITQNKPKNAQFNVETDYRLPAIFYQISTGDVPNSLWKECQFSLNNKEDKVRTTHENKSLIEFKRRLNKLEKTTRIILNTVSEISELLTASVSIPIWALICACPLLVLGGFGLGKWTNNDVSILAPSPSFSPSPSPSSSVSPSPSPSPLPATSWKATVKAIDALRDEFVSMAQDKSTVEAAIIKNIAAGFSYAYKAENPKEWTPKIKNFQKENSIIETGSISQNDETYKALKCEVAKELELTDKVPDCPAHSD